MKSAFPYSRKERSALAWIVFLIIVMRAALGGRPEEQIYSRPYGEDAFYLFSAAEHFAQGEGFTVDGKHPTNGVQPLIVTFYAPLFQLADFDKLMALRLGFCVAALIDAITAILLALLVRSVARTSGYVYSDGALRSPPVVAAALWAFLYPIYIHTSAGLETGVSSLCIVSSLLLYAEIHRLRRAGEIGGIGKWIALGVMLGLTVLARVDAVMLVAAICLIEALRYRGRGIGHAFVVGFFSALVSAPWWWYNYTTFGSLMPQSGMAESLYDELGRNIWMAVTVITDAASVFFFLPKAVEVSHLITVLWAIVVIGALWFIHRKTGLFQTLPRRIHFFPLLPLILFCVEIVVFYVFFFGAPHFIPRYFQPFRILGVILASIAIPHVADHVRRSHSGKRLLAALLIVAGLFSFVRYGYMFTFESASDFYSTGKWALSIPDARIGMDQSGTAGFIAANVTNLDGKVNYEALQARLQGDIGAYVARQRFDYIADWEAFVRNITFSSATHGALYKPFDTIGRIHIYKLAQ